MSGRRYNVTVERLSNGRYRAAGNNPEDRAEWDPFRPLTDACFHADATPRFRRELRQLDLGIACKNCGFIEVEHHIDGEERAPCNDYVAASRGRR